MTDWKITFDINCLLSLNIFNAKYIYKLSRRKVNERRKGGGEKKRTRVDGYQTKDGEYRDVQWKPPFDYIHG